MEAREFWEELEVEWKKNKIETLRIKFSNHDFSGKYRYIYISGLGKLFSKFIRLCLVV